VSTYNKIKSQFDVNSLKTFNDFNKTVNQNYNLNSLKQNVSDVEIVDFVSIDQLVNDFNIFKETISNNETESINSMKTFKNQLSSVLEDLKKEQSEINRIIGSKQGEINRNKTLKFRTSSSSDYYDNKIKRLETELSPLNTELNQIKSEITMIKIYMSQLTKEIEYQPYLKITGTEEYLKFVKNYDCDYQNINYELLRECGNDVLLYINMMSVGKTDKELEQMLKDRTNEIDRIAIIEHLVKNAPNGISIDENGISSDLMDSYFNYMYMTEDQKNMYHYLFSTKGEKEATKYLSVIQDDINKAHGADMANEFISKLELDDEGKIDKTLANLFDVSIKGVGDGINTFFSGIENALINNATLTADEYEKMLILQYLEENSLYYANTYQFNSALGNMLPAITTSCIVSVLATPAAGKLVGNGLMGLSSFGNAKHQALVDGNSVLTSTLYGLLIGSSEVTLGYYLGKIPGLSETSGLTLKNLLSEGSEEFIQTYIEQGCQAVILQKDIDWSSVQDEAMQSFGMGFLMAGLLNGGEAVVNVSISGTKYAIDTAKTIKYLQENKGVDVLTAIKEVNRIKLNSDSNTFELSEKYSNVIKNKNFLPQNTKLTKTGINGTVKSVNFIDNIRINKFISKLENKSSTVLTSNTKNHIRADVNNTINIYSNIYSNKEAKKRIFNVLNGFVKNNNSNSFLDYQLKKEDIVTSLSLPYITDNLYYRQLLIDKQNQIFDNINKKINNIFVNNGRNINLKTSTILVEPHFINEYNRIKNVRCGGFSTILSSGKPINVIPDSKNISTLESSIFHEGVHEYSQHQNGGGFHLNSDPIFRGINEGATQYITRKEYPNSKTEYDPIVEVFENIEISLNNRTGIDGFNTITNLYSSGDVNGLYRLFGNCIKDKNTVIQKWRDLNQHSFVIAANTSNPGMYSLNDFNTAKFELNNLANSIIYDMIDMTTNK